MMDKNKNLLILVQEMTKSILSLVIATLQNICGTLDYVTKTINRK